jgi:dTDP-4-amino-4,6-dideoxygalactose transaminase
MRPRYPVVRPPLPAGSEVAAELEAVLRDGIGTLGPVTERFETAFAAFAGVDHAVAMSSCTTGLILTMQALGLEGEVIVPANAFNSSATAVLWAGLTPVFCDCDPASFSIDIASAEALVGPRTSAVMAVGIYGWPPDVDRIAAFAAAHGLALIFDSAMGAGTLHAGRQVGSFGAAEVFSLSTKKLVTACEGGMVATSDGALAAKLRKLRDYGRRPGGGDFEELGLSARFSELHAVVGLASLASLPVRRGARRRHVTAMTAALAAAEGLAVVPDPPWGEASGLLMPVRVVPRAGPRRDALMDRLLARSIQTSRYFSPALHHQSVFRAHPHRRAPELPGAETLAEEIMALPLYDEMSRADIDAITGAVLASLAEAMER